MMKKVRFKDLYFSQLMLGTCQLGLEYGIANKCGRPLYKTARDIVACAYEGGVNCLDTARAYGESEVFLGKAMAELGIADKMIVVSKIPPMGKGGESIKAINLIIEESVTRSLKYLKLEVLPICLFHREEDFRYVETLLKLKDKGLVRYIGSSIMTPDAAISIISSGLADVIQIPTNILDHRFIRLGICGNAKKQGVAVLIRSIYLQGLVLMEENRIPYGLRKIIPFRRRIQDIASKSEMTPAELAMRYTLGIDGLTCAIVGVDSPDQISQNIKLASGGPLSHALMKTINDAIPDLPDNLIVPTNWQKCKL